jgi:hypothetical protein
MNIYSSRLYTQTAHDKFNRKSDLVFSAAMVTQDLESWVEVSVLVDLDVHGLVFTAAAIEQDHVILDLDGCTTIA